MKFRENLLRLRQERGYTQERLAELVGVSRQAVAKWEAGQSTPEVDKLLRLSELFGCTMDELVTGDPAPASSAQDEPPAGPAPEAPPAADYPSHVLAFSAAVGTGVGLILTGVALNCFAEAFQLGDTLSTAAVLGGVAAGLAFILPASFEHAAFRKRHPVLGPTFSQGELDLERQDFARSLVVGIGAIMLGIVCATGISGDLGAGVMMLCVAIGTGLITRASVRHGLSDVEAYNREAADEPSEPERRRLGRVCGAIMLGATIVALLLLFGGQAAANNGYASGAGLVQVFWLPWPIAGITCGIISLLMRHPDEEALK